MLRRCENPDEAGYSNYGGRGITVCPEWRDPRAYIDYVEQELGPRPDPSCTIDRVDNDGNYEPGNIRWATRSQQNANQRQRVSVGYPVGASGYRGVRLNKKSGRYHARLQRDGREYSLGYFSTPEEAARAYDAAVRARGEWKTRLNFPDEVL